MSNSNTLHFFYGPMASGKSAKLIQEYYNFNKKNADAWAIKPAVDRTSEPKIVSRLGIECPATVIKEIKWEDIIRTHKFYSKIYLIDEIQFFKPKDIDNLVKLADTYQRLIYCYGLLVDINEKLFPAAKRLIEVGANLHPLETTCEMVGCMGTATHHLRYHPSGYLLKGGKSVEVDDGHVIYKSVCRQCYNREMQKFR